MEDVCSVEECDKPRKSWGYCAMHYGRMKRHGSLEVPPKKPARLCSIDGCSKKHRSKGYCSMHLRRWHKSGNPHYVAPRKAREVKPLDERFWDKVVYSPTCWIWTAFRGVDGYGEFRKGKRMVKAHRYSFELAYGEIEQGLVIDHKFAYAGCQPFCVNPSHLRAITQKQNMENRKGAQKRNRTGVRGVTTCKITGKYLGHVGYLGKAKYVGRYNTLEEAERAVTAKRLELYTHSDMDKE